MAGRKPFTLPLSNIFRRHRDSTEGRPKRLKNGDEQGRPSSPLPALSTTRPESDGSKGDTDTSTIKPTPSPSNGELQSQHTAAFERPLMTRAAAADSLTQQAPPATIDTPVPIVSKELCNQAHSYHFPASNDASLSDHDHAVPLQPWSSPTEPLPAKDLPSLEQSTTLSLGSFDEDALLQSKSEVQFSKPSSGNHSLWDRAMTQLRESNEDSNIVAIVDEFATDPAGDNTDGNPSTVKSLAKGIKEEMEQEIKFHQQDSHTYRFVEKTVSILNKFVAVVGIAINFDPVHAALPWAAVRFVLIALTSNSELKRQVLGGIAKVTSLVLQCEMYRQLYADPDPTLRPPENVLNALETSIVQAYAKSLLFLGFAIHRQRSWSRFIDASFKLEDMDKYVKGLLESGSQLDQAANNCESYCNLLNRSAVQELHTLAKESNQATLYQNALVLNMYQDIVLDKLHTAEGAAFDHLDHEHEAECHPKTRVALLGEIDKWIDNPNSKCIFWLQGMAGTGKSTISRTVARKLGKRLGASFFFKRGEGDRGKAARFFTTIASQLVHQLPTLAQHVKRAIEDDPGISERFLKEQFEKLILLPLEKVDTHPQNPLTTMIVIDALDECEPEWHATTIISLLPQVSQLSSVRLKFFITSRPEFPILGEFRKLSGIYQDLVLHRVDEHIVAEDISVYLDSELSKTRNDYNRSCPDWPLPSDWPGQTNLQTLVKMAVPLFIFAKTVCLFVQDRECGDPDEQLHEILQYQTMGHEFQLHATYLPILKQMLMKRADSGFVSRSGEEQEKIVKEFCEIVGALVILADPLPIKSLAQLLGIPIRIVGHRLSMLHSVLNIPSDPTAPVKILHLSFRDFLVNPKKRATNQFWVDEEMTHEKLVSKCLKLLSGEKYLKKNICSLNRPGKSRTEVDKHTLLKYLPSEVQYACLYWVYHLKGSKRIVKDHDQVYKFLKRYLLCWFEALSLMGRISESIGLIDDLQTITDSKTGIETSSFLHDAKRFILHYRPVIDLAPLQIYSSALVFAPEDSVIRKTFKDSVSSWITTKPVVQSTWSPCLQTLEGHSRWVRSVAFSHDSALLASASDDTTVKIWDTATGKCAETLEGHCRLVRSVAFSHDSALLVSASDDSIVKIWDAATGKCIQTLEGYYGQVRSVVCTHDSVLLVSASDDNIIKIWDPAAGKCTGTLEGHSDRVKSITFSHDSALLASASGDSTVKIWDTAGKCVMTLEGHSRPVRSLAFSYDSALLASASDDSTVKIWDTATGICIQTLEGHSRWVRSVVFSHNSVLLASASDDSTVKIWDTATGKCTETLEGHSSRVRAVAFSHDSGLLASASDDSTVKIWSTAAGKHTETLEGHSHSVSLVAFSHNSALLVSASGDNTVKIWDTATGKSTKTLESHSGLINSVAFSHDSALLASASDDNTVKIWDTATGKCMHTLEGHSDWVRSVIFSHDSALLASASDDSTVKVWDTATGNCKQTLEGHRDWVRSLAFSHDSALLASASDDNTIKIWSTSKGECIQTLNISRAFFSKISFDDTGSYLLTKIGAITLGLPSASSKVLQELVSPAPRFKDYSIGYNGNWITRDSENVLWLPPEYRPSCSAVAGLIVAIGCVSGRVWLLRLSADAPVT